MENSPEITTYDDLLQMEREKEKQRERKSGVDSAALTKAADQEAVRSRISKSRQSIFVRPSFSLPFSIFVLMLVLTAVSIYLLWNDYRHHRTIKIGTSNLYLFAIAVILLVVSGVWSLARWFKHHGHFDPTKERMGDLWVSRFLFRITVDRALRRSEEIANGDNGQMTRSQISNTPISVGALSRARSVPLNPEWWPMYDDRVIPPPPRPKFNHGLHSETRNRHSHRKSELETVPEHQDYEANSSLRSRHSDSNSKINMRHSQQSNQNQIRSIIEQETFDMSGSTLQSFTERRSDASQLTIPKAALLHNMAANISQRSPLDTLERKLSLKYGKGPEDVDHSPGKAAKEDIVKPNASEVGDKFEERQIRYGCSF